MTTIPRTTFALQFLRSPSNISLGTFMSFACPYVCLRSKPRMKRRVRADGTPLMDHRFFVLVCCFCEWCSNFLIISILAKGCTFTAANNFYSRRSIRDYKIDALPGTDRVTHHAITAQYAKRWSSPTSPSIYIKAITLFPSPGKHMRFCTHILLAASTMSTNKGY